MASPSTNAGSTAWPLAASASTISTETARKTGNQALGVMKIADSASAVPMSVTKQALMMSLPIRDWLSPVSTSTAYTTASDATNTSHGVLASRSSTLPATTPSLSSSSATESPTSTEIMLASSTTADSTAASPTALTTRAAAGG